MLASAALLTLLISIRTTAQENPAKPCSSKVVSAEIDRWRDKGFAFYLIKDGAFVQGQYAYFLGIAFEGTLQERTGDLQFLIYRSLVGKNTFALVHAEEIAVLDSVEFRSDRESCVTPGGFPYFRVSVVDLRGNGSRQIIVQSNSIGACSSCLSLVQVYQVEDGKITKVVKEYYNDIKFASGQGLWIQSYKTDSLGRPSGTYEKTFFTGDDSGRKPGN